MYLLRKPPPLLVDQFRDRQRQLTFSYEYDLIGATRNERFPEGYDAVHYRTFLGHGKETFEAAKRALKSWRQFPEGVAEAVPAATPVREGETVAVLLGAGGIWKLAACRIVYVVNDRLGDCERFGYAYGTLPGHVERGEERFLVEWNQADDTVWYDLRSFSRPATLLTWLGMPVARYYQRRFAHRSAKAMRQAVDRPGQGEVGSSPRERLALEAE